MKHENLNGRVAVVTGGGGVLCGDFSKAVSYTHLDVYKRQIYYLAEYRLEFISHKRCEFVKLAHENHLNLSYCCLIHIIV